MAYVVMDRRPFCPEKFTISIPSILMLPKQNTSVKKNMAKQGSSTQSYLFGKDICFIRKNFLQGRILAGNF
ncbi:MAG: hypothetical protein ACOX0K_01180 [Oscillospiraceae bacterium]